jgi:hypothetical protein
MKFSWSLISGDPLPWKFFALKPCRTTTFISTIERSLQVQDIQVLDLESKVLLDFDGLDLLEMSVHFSTLHAEGQPYRDPAKAFPSSTFDLAQTHPC